MVFSSAVFLFAFLPLVFLLSRLIRRPSAQNWLLALASLVFYAFGQLTYVPLFLASVLINYLAGLLLGGRARGSKLVLTLAVALNLGLLVVFKYTDFLLANLNALLGLRVPMTGIVLPIGISFFTFQGLSYVIDVYRKSESGTKNFLHVLLYIAFFPQLIAGPIVKYHDIAPQLRARALTPEGTAAGLRRFAVGLAKKVLVANAVGYLADTVFNRYLPQYGASLDWRLAWLGGICYTLQIYFDFSGYSDMAIGMGRMFGFTILENFKFPYAALSIRDFWRRWHISLSTWFREYLYIPLGGSRRGRGRAAVNRFIVFFCTGIWHGANWTFLVWGLAHGLLSSLEGAGVLPMEKLGQSRLGRLVARVYTLLAVMLLFTVFRADSLGDAFTMLGAMFSWRVLPEGGYLLRALLTPAALCVLCLALLLAGRAGEKLRERLPFDAAALSVPAELGRNLLCLGLYALSVLSLARGGFNPFIYFQF